MKEATGELNMTVITVIAIAAVATLFYTLVWPAIQKAIVNNTCATQANEVLRHSSNYGLFNQPKHEIDSNSDLSGSMFNTLAPGGSHQYFQTAFSKYGDYVKEINKNS